MTPREEKTFKETRHRNLKRWKAKQAMMQKEDYHMGRVAENVKFH